MREVIERTKNQLRTRPRAMDINVSVIVRFLVLSIDDFNTSLRNCLNSYSYPSKRVKINRILSLSFFPTSILSFLSKRCRNLFEDSGIVSFFVEMRESAYSTHSL